MTINTGKLALTVWMVWARVRGYMASCMVDFYSNIHAIQAGIHSLKTHPANRMVCCEGDVDAPADQAFAAGEIDHAIIGGAAGQLERILLRAPRLLC